MTSGKRDLRLWLSGAGLDAAVDQAWFVALGWLAVRSDVPAAVILAAGTAPQILVLIGGVLADRWGLLRTSSVTLWVRAGLLLLLGVALLLWDSPSGLLLATLALLVGVFDAIHMPAMTNVGRLLRDDESELVRVEGHARAITIGAGLIAAPAAAYVVASRPEAVGFVGAALLAVAGLCFRRLRTMLEEQQPAESFDGAEPGPATSVLTQLRRGIGRFRDRTFALILSAYAVSNIATAAPVFLGVPLQAKEYGWSGLVYAVVATGYAAGVGIGALAASSIRSRAQTPIAAAMAALMGAGAGVLVMTLARDPWLVASGACATGALIGSTGPVMKAYISLRIPRSELGTIGAVVQSTIYLAVPAGHLIYGTLYSLGGITLAGSTLAATLLLVGGACWWFSRRTPRTMPAAA